MRTRNVCTLLEILVIMGILIILTGVITIVGVIEKNGRRTMSNGGFGHIEQALGRHGQNPDSSDLAPCWMGKVYPNHSTDSGAILCPAHMGPCCIRLAEQDDGNAWVAKKELPPPMSYRHYPIVSVTPWFFASDVPVRP